MAKKKFKKDDSLNDMKKAIRTLGKEGKAAFRSAVKDIVGYAHDEFAKGDFDNAAEYYELAAWAYSKVGGIRYWREARKYKGMARDIQKYQDKYETRGAEGGLVSKTLAMSVLAIVFICLSLSFSYLSITGNAIGQTNNSLSITLSVAFLIIGLIFALIKVRSKIQN